jgi:hypothetical protein
MSNRHSFDAFLLIMSALPPVLRLRHSCSSPSHCSVRPHRSDRAFLRLQTRHLGARRGCPSAPERVQEALHQIASARRLKPQREVRKQHNNWGPEGTRTLNVSCRLCL